MPNTLNDTNPEAQALARQVVDAHMQTPANEQPSLSECATRPVTPSLQTEEEAAHLAEQVLFYASKK